MKKLILILILAPTFFAQNKTPLTFQDIMEFKEIIDPAISSNGQWIAYTLQPDRGDGTGILKNINSMISYEIERGKTPSFSNNNNWAGFTIVPEQLLVENSKKDDKLYNNLVIYDLRNGEKTIYEYISDYAFTENGDWLAVLFADTADKKKSKSPLKVGTELLLKYLPDNTVVKLQSVTEFVFDSLSNHLAVAIRDTTSHNNRLVRVDLVPGSKPHIEIITSPYSYFSSLTWNSSGRQLAFIKSQYDSSNLPQPGSLELWSTNNSYKTVLTSEELSDDWVIPLKNNIKFSQDGERLFFGRLPKDIFSTLYREKENLSYQNLKDEGTILSKAEVDVWHGNDGRINPNQKKEWEKNKEKTYTSVYHVEMKKYVPLADEDFPFLNWNNSNSYAIAGTNKPYLKDITWEGEFFDYYRIDLNSGDRQQIAERIEDKMYFSPGGKYGLYYSNKHWHLINLPQLTMKNLTIDIDVPFYNEDHDYPSPAPGYGIAGWTKNDESVLIYDKYDIWQFPTSGKKPILLTDGRDDEISFRVKIFDKEKEYFEPNEQVFLEGYHQKEKYTALFTGRIGTESVKEKLKKEKRINFISKSQNSDRIIYTEQTYMQFPDLIAADTTFSYSIKVSDANPQINNFLWGNAELVEWETEDDIELQGVVIKPDNFDEDRKYPVIVYFYRLFSQRLYEFNQPRINHRPCFPFYTSNDYIIFLPDIKYEVGLPGQSATDCLVSGVEHLIDVGIADPDAIGLHGHSWSGYQTAFVITQTDTFKCAIAGAPVSNMTSAYSGIRWGTGLARQFQYEQSQSRIGGTLVDMTDKYINNSPVFFADKVNTPLLLMFGDEDEAVPWYQGIELYLALRRFDKDVIFLQYRGEPHHPKKYPNKLDYAKRMKEYFDYHLKGTPPANWIIDGVPYSGK